jgi:hypothetical protein
MKRLVKFRKTWLGIFCCLFLLEACCVGSVLPPTPLPSEKILDMHCHTAGIGAGNSGCFISKAMRESYKFGVYLSAFGVDEEMLNKEGDALIIQKLAENLEASKHVSEAIILALDGVINEDGTLNKEKMQLPF